MLLHVIKGHRCNNISHKYAQYCCGLFCGGYIVVLVRFMPFIYPYPSGLLHWQWRHLEDIDRLTSTWAQQIMNHVHFPWDVLLHWCQKSDPMSCHRYNHSSRDQRQSFSFSNLHTIGSFPFNLIHDEWFVDAKFLWTAIRHNTTYPDSKVYGANCNMGPVGPRWALCWPHEPCY